MQTGSTGRRRRSWISSNPSATLSRTYLVKTLCRADKVRFNNPDFLFLSSHYTEVQEYLALLDWDLRKDDFNGYFYVINTDKSNCCQLDKDQASILLALRMIYDENGNGVSCVSSWCSSPRCAPKPAKRPGQAMPTSARLAGNASAAPGKSCWKGESRRLPEVTVTKKPFRRK